MNQNAATHTVMWIWIFFAVIAIIGAILGIRWAKATGQFDEDIKYQIFTEPDDEIFQSEEEETVAGRQVQP